MKTTENISLAGYAFTIETDAFEELNTYLEEIRNSFSSEAGAEEITEDIEERIAELISEKYVQGMVVNIEMILEIEKRIGNPKEVAGEDSPSETSAPKADTEKRTWKSKRLYRNIDERVIGGVCSGLSAWSGLDKVLFRLLFLIFFLIGFSKEGLFCIPMVLYICLWIAMPAARTVEQRCEMKGKPIDLAGFRSKDFDINKEVKEISGSPAGRILKRTVEIFIGLILLICGLSGLLCSIVIPSIPPLADFITGCQDMSDSFMQFNSEIIASTKFWGLVLVTFVIASVGMIYGGIMLTFELKAPSWKPGLILFIAWIISVLVLIAWIIRTFTVSLPGILV